MDTPDQLTLLILENFKSFDQLCQLSRVKVPTQTYADVKLWLMGDLVNIHRFGKEIQLHYRNSKRYPHARNEPLEWFYERILMIPGADQLVFSKDKSAFQKLGLGEKDQVAFQEFVDHLQKLGLPQNLPRFWPDHARSYGGITGPSFEEWFYSMISKDDTFLRSLFGHLRFTKSSFPILYDYISGHRFNYLFEDAFAGSS